MNKRLIVLIGMAAVACFFQTASALASQAGKSIVFTSILPQEYFVERIGGDRVDVHTLVTPGSSPATYAPTPRQMASLSEAAIFFRIGVPFENAFIPKIKGTMPGLRIVDTRKGIRMRRMKGHYPQPHNRAADAAQDHKTAAREGHAHDNGGTDPHIWLSPRLAMIQARTIADGLIEIDPGGKAVYQSNLAALLTDLEALDVTLGKTLAPFKGKRFMVFHPAWGYFADAYGLKQAPIAIEGKDPSGRQLDRVIRMAKTEGIRVIFVQPQFSMASARRIAGEIHGVVVPINPLAKNYVRNLEQVAAAVREGLKNKE